MTTLTSVQLTRLMADPDRRRVIAALVLADEPIGSALLAERAGIELRATVDALARLTAATLVDEAAGAYTLVDEAFQAAARAEAPAAPPSAHGDQPVDVAKILDVAFRDGKLVQWPSKRSKRLVVLDYLSQQFEIGTRYTEVEVNDMLRSFNEDVATSRRYLVDEQFMDRGEGRYWRCGGSV